MSNHDKTGGQPVGYYINAINIMCEYTKGKINDGTLTKEGVGAFMHTTARNLNYPHLQEAFGSIIECTHALYKYSIKKNFVDSNLSYEDFMADALTDNLNIEDKGK